MNKNIPKLLMTIGISGSGKTTFLKKNFDYDKVAVCPDAIRKEITGNISDMSNDKYVWKLAYERTVDNLIKYNYSVFDATHVNPKTFFKTINTITKLIDNLDIICYIFTPDIKLGQDRIKKDLHKGIDRSKVPDDIIIKQYFNFKKWIQRIPNNDLKYEIHYIDAKTGLEITESEFLKKV